MAYELVIYEVDDRIATVTLNRPDVLNAIVSWRGRNPDAVVILKGDKDAAFGTIADLMNALAEAKTLRFNLMTNLKRRTQS